MESATAASAVTHGPGWVAHVHAPGAPERARSPLIGALPGEGIGPEVVSAALDALRCLEAAGAPTVAVELGGSIGRTAERETGTALPESVAGFCEDVFERGGAILTGPGSGRYVYDLRRRLGLFLKISPIQARSGLPRGSPLRAEVVRDVDLLVVRENLGGVYQGSASEDAGLVEQRFSYSQTDVRRFL